MKRPLMIMLAIALTVGTFAIAATVIFSTLEDEPSRLVTADVVNITPVGHRHSTGYVAELNINERKVYHEFTTAPEGGTVGLYEITGSHGVRYSVYNPEDTAFLGNGLLLLVAALPAAFVGLIAFAAVPNRPHRRGCLCVNCKFDMKAVRRQMRYQRKHPEEMKAMVDAANRGDKDELARLGTAYRENTLKITRSTLKD